MSAQAETNNRWPQFEMVVFNAPTGIPYGWDSQLIAVGVPKDLLGAYHATDNLALLEGSDGMQFVRFGISGHYDNICLNPRTGEVVDLIYVPSDTTNLASGVHGTPLFVNSSLNQFSTSVHAVIHRFPFDTGHARQDRNSTDEELAQQWERAAEELLDMLHRIDSAVGTDPDGFWITFVSDVQMGEYSTEMILGNNS